ncbi:MAG: hypothetical protein A8274_522 [Halanaerobium sp. 4-GBenrich]|uniref:DUF2490 domain-containing protein n=1 Tax=Halanaerobium congolense TaxID=54121 RepID=A0A1G6RWL0_9FIRM|nr:hypothetical protein [Halanaerobium congolense]ODS50516.1 MAG: hypothetical protein A8274_522 [Halanaerobium sp. 4-GBenrich]PTX15781.1 hypothetical protein C7953_0461 [Halanaerobium congolense]PXV70025.1 hypothetical protein C8C78_10117 [Halanaerobium congolense]TDP24210.1 hypothetical protein C8C79_107105 [Halanaerobium congolense]TDS34005.1 hypothetical protein BY453_103165 [Halanaerobium congolense]
MKKNTIKLGMSFLLVLAILTLSISTSTAVAKKYQPEISGSIEKGDRLYSDPGNWENDDPLDYYRYDKQWLKYRQKLAVGEYYYLKVQRQEKIYEQSQSYNSLNLETEANYTFYLNDKLRNRFKVLVRDKDYLEEKYDYKDYQLARLQYTLQYKRNKIHDYELILQKQWTQYQLSPDSDYQRERIALKWGWKLSQNLELNSKIQYDWQRNDNDSSRSNKDGRKISMNFKYKL